MSNWICGKCASAYDDIPEHHWSCPKWVRRGKAATKGELRREIAELRRVGSMLANIAYNLGPNVAGSLEPNRRTMRELQKQWDAIRRAEK